ncbi:hypothetical protein [Bacteroides caecigallinarum]|uniref:hypothetical protein n=1 Tax=Bacteroides caecigallinarum TaxID=1411144 RepID=UPI001F2FD7E3|nr:hypothetical protein [Bacteroides caecigallinarum]MCF2552256.1 hypothetical protein [Bacteroides caecigallinarum]
MKRFASHRLYIPRLDLMLVNNVVEIDSISREVLSYYPFVKEIPFTEWLNGLIVLSADVPVLYNGNQYNIHNPSTTVLYIDSDKKIRSVLPVNADKVPLKAYYITLFNVSEMRFHEDTRVVQLF